METFAFASAVRGYHVYKDVWKPSIGEKLVAKREFNNPMDKHAVKVVKDDETVGHLPREFSRIAWYFLACSGEISVEVIGRRRHCKQLCGGMEIPCQLEFNCSNKAQIKTTGFNMFNLYLLKGFFSSICDPYKPVYSL